MWNRRLQPMPSQMNGIGHRFVGASERRDDGSFITTTWFSILVPLIPLRSQRVEYLSGMSFNNGKRSVDNYRIVEQVSLDIKSILKYYGIWAILLFLSYSMFDGAMHESYFLGDIGYYITVLGLLATILWWFLLALEVVLKPK